MLGGGYDPRKAPPAFESSYKQTYEKHQPAGELFAANQIPIRS